MAKRLKRPRGVKITRVTKVGQAVMPTLMGPLGRPTVRQRTRVQPVGFGRRR